MERNKEDRINENIMVNSKIEKIDKYLIYKAARSTCKIIASKNIGTGFLMKLYKGNNPYYCLMTNEHVIKNRGIL